MNLMLAANPFVSVVICLLAICDTFSFPVADNFTQPTTTWMIRERNYDLVCILIRFSAFFRIKYQTANSSREGLVNLPLSSDASLTSESTHGHSCVTNNDGYLHFDLSFGRESAGLHNLVTYFRKTAEVYQLLEFDLQYVINPTEFPDHWKPKGTLMLATFTSDQFLVPRKMSYACKTVQELQMSAIDDVSFFVRHMQFEAFTFQPTPVFSEAVECSFDHQFYTDYAAVIVFMGTAVIGITCIYSSLFVIHKLRQTALRDTITTPIVSGNLSG